MPFTFTPELTFVYFIILHFIFCCASIPYDPVSWRLLAPNNKQVRSSRLYKNGFINNTNSKLRNSTTGPMEVAKDQPASIEKFSEQNTRPYSSPTVMESASNNNISTIENVEFESDSFTSLSSSPLRDGSEKTSLKVDEWKWVVNKNKSSDWYKTTFPTMLPIEEYDYETEMVTVSEEDLDAEYKVGTTTVATSVPQYLQYSNDDDVEYGSNDSEEFDYYEYTSEKHESEGTTRKTFLEPKDSQPAPNENTFHRSVSNNQELYPIISTTNTYRPNNGSDSVTTISTPSSGESIHSQDLNLKSVNSVVVIIIGLSLGFLF